MGVTSGSKLLYHLAGLTFGHVTSMCRKRAEEAGRVGAPSVAADMSWLCHRLRRSSVAETTKLVVALINKFIIEGFVFYAVYDPEGRHHSKKVSIYREFERQQSISECIKVKTKLLSISKDLRDRNFQSKEEEKILHTNLKVQESKAKKAEKTLADSQEIPEILAAVRLATGDLTNDYPGVVMVVEGKYQADSIIQYFLSSKTIDLAIGNDTDFSVVAGDACLQMSSFNINVKASGKNAGTNINKVTIATGSKLVINKVRDYLGSNIGTYEDAKIPLLDEILDVRTRCLIAVLLSNDTFPSSLKCHTFFHGIGAATVRDIITGIQKCTNSTDVAFDILLDTVLNYATKKNKKNQDSKKQLPRFVIKALVEAMAYEPYSITQSGELLYAVTPPSEPVDHYIEDFAGPALVQQKSQLCCCPGPTPHFQHTFMKEEGFRQCSKCKEQYCVMCVSDDNKCIPCLSAETSFVDPVLKMTDSELRLALSKKIEVPNDMPIAEMQELYVCIVEGSAMDSLDTALLDKVMFPLYGSDAVDHKHGIFKFVTHFDFRDGARFIQDRFLSLEQRVQVMNLLAALITFGLTNKLNMPEIAALLPNMLADFASNARVDSGERLMKRCVRHATDSKTPSILHAHGSIIEHQGEVGLLIHDRIAPSYKDGMYNVTTAFTHSKLLATTCECKAGAEKTQRSSTENSDTCAASEKHICVHCLPTLYKLTILLMDGLAEHALVEFAATFSTHEENLLSLENLSRLSGSILTLMAAANITPDESTTCTTSPSKLLEAFRVGTESQKKILLTTPPDPAKLCPLRKFKRESPEEKAKIALRMKEESQKPDTTDVDVTIPPPDYLSVWRLCHVLQKLGIFSKRSSSQTIKLENTSIVGYRLLELRARKIGTSEKAMELVDAGWHAKMSKLFSCLGERCDPRAKHVQLKHAENNKRSSVTSPPLEQFKNAAKRHKPERKKAAHQHQKITRHCYYIGCNNNITCGSVVVPQQPPPPPLNANKDRWVTYYKKCFRRREFLRRIGGNENDNRKDMRICKEHPSESVRKSFCVKIPDQDNPQGPPLMNFFVRDEFKNLPLPLGPKSNRPEVKGSTISNGTGKTRELARYSVLDQNPKSNAKEHVRNECLAVLHCLEINNHGGRTALKEIHPNIRRLTELDQHPPTPEKERHKKEGHGKENNVDGRKCVPILQPESISDKEVKERTGFQSLLLLVCFIAIVCDGDIDTITDTKSKMTWFEEWFFYFEMVWGRSILRWVDGQRYYKIHDQQLRDVFKHKLSLVIKAVARWPRYAHHSEDMELRSEKWRERYANKRIIMWDNTNVNFQGKPTLADLQRLTYSLYYGGNVAKGAVFLQLCGWLGGWELWLGAISDTNYFEGSGILEFQNLFQKNDPSSDLSFTNILDKGYRSILAAWRTGGQLLLQPFFARSDRKFTSREVLLSGAVASDRSGNERAVHQLKQSYMLSRGIHTRQDFDRFADIWIAWGFQCNFMFKPVL